MKKGIIAIILVLLSALVLIGCSKSINVPDVVGLGADEARKALIEEGIDQENISFIDENGDIEGPDTVTTAEGWIVMKQSPTAGEEVDANGTVDLTVMSYKVEFEGLVYASIAGGSCKGYEASNAISKAKEYDYATEFIDVKGEEISAEVQSKPEGYIITGINSFDMGSKNVVFEVDTVKSIESKIAQEERVEREKAKKAEQEKKAAEEKAKKEEEEERAREKEREVLDNLTGKSLYKAIKATKKMRYLTCRYAMETLTGDLEWISVVTGKEPSEDDYEYGAKESFFSKKNGFKKHHLKEDYWITEVEEIDNGKFIIRYADTDSARRGFVIEP